MARDAAGKKLIKFLGHKNVGHDAGRPHPVFFERRIEMTPEEQNQTGKYSDEYQNEFTICFAIMVAVSMAIAAILTMLGA